jgi:hypothetical protein
MSKISHALSGLPEMESRGRNDQLQMDKFGIPFQTFGSTVTRPTQTRHAQCFIPQG